MGSPTKIDIVGIVGEGIIRLSTGNFELKQDVKF